LQDDGGKGQHDPKKKTGESAVFPLRLLNGSEREKKNEMRKVNFRALKLAGSCTPQ
jgi:hypothetical protein